MLLYLIYLHLKNVINLARKRINSQRQLLYSIKSNEMDNKLKFKLNIKDIF